MQAAHNRAADACKSVVTKWKQGNKASKSHFISPHVVYDHRTTTFYDDCVDLATTDGRTGAGYILPDEDGDTSHPTYLFADEYEITGAERHSHDGTWVLRIHWKAGVESDTSETKQATPESGTVFRIDLSVNILPLSARGRSERATITNSASRCLDLTAGRNHSWAADRLISTLPF